MKPTKSYFLFFLLPIVCLITCNKNSEKPDYSLSVNVQLDTIIDITPGTAVIKGSITLKASEYHLTSYGVDYDTLASFGNQIQTVIPNADNKQSVVFSDTVKNLRQITTYSVRIRALINPQANGQSYYYSAVKSFKTTKYPLQIFKASPDSGTYRDVFTIKGKGFSRNVADNQVSINGVSATVLAAYNDSLRVVVPKKCMNGNISVKLGNEVTNGPQFKYINESYVVYTFAGADPFNPGYIDGPGATAKFGGPEGLIIDKDGNILVGEYGHIRKITPDGIVSTLAGVGKGYLDGSGSIAKFYYITDLTIDQSTGNIFAVDSWNHCIRIIKSDGTEVKTFAGTDTSGYKDGWGTAARFDTPQGISKDSHGNLYIADSHNNRIRKIDGFGQVTTFKSITYPTSIIFDGNKTFFVVANSAKTIYKLDTLANLSAITFTFGAISGMVFDPQNNLFVADQGNNCIYKITAAGQISLLSGNLTESKIVNGGVSKARFKQLWGITIDQNDNLYVVDQNCIRKIEKVE